MKTAVDSDFDNVIYSNNHVTISLTSVQVDQKSFPLKNISSYRLITNTPNRKYTLTLIALGAIITLVAQFNFIPHYLIYNLQFGSYTFSQIDLITGFGIMLSAAGLLIIFFRPASYTIQIISDGMTISILTSKRKGYTKAVGNAIGMALRYTTKGIYVQSPATQLPGLQ